MKQCPVTQLPIQENPEWIAPHADNRYCTVFSIIGNDIVHFVHRTEEDAITLAGIDSIKFQALLKRLDLADKKLFMLVNLEKVTEISHRYRKDFLNFIFNRGRNIRIIVIDNINDTMRIDTERFRQIAPEKTLLTCTGNYREAMEIIMNLKDSDLSKKPVKEHPSDMNDKGNDLRTAMTTISLLDILNQPVYPPSQDHELYPCFVALEAFRKDMTESSRSKRRNRIYFQGHTS